MSEQLTRRNFLKGVAGVVGYAAVGSLAGCANANDTSATTAATTAAETTTAAATTVAETTTAAAATSGKYIPGTYTGTADGIHSTITVTMTFDTDKVTDVVLDVSGETPGYGQDAGDALREALLTAQSTEIDGVSGSTITSHAVIAAADKCFAQARGEAVIEVVTVDKGSEDDWLGTEPNIDEGSIAETWDTDILIVGAGNGGMCAAAYAAKNGLKFRIIEQNPVVQDTRHWYGAVDSSEAKKVGATINRKKLLAEISRYASGKCDQRVVSTWIEESAAMHDFVSGILESDPYNYKCTFTYGEEARWPESEDSPDYMFPEQEHTYHGSEIPRNQVFQQYIEGLGYSVDFNTSLVKLEKDGNGRVTGIIAQKSSGEFVRINAAKGVLLACGGYPGNPYMMEALDPLGTSVTTACSYSPADQGMGIRAAIWVGASLDKEPAPMLFDRGLVAPGVDGGYVESSNAFGGKAFPGTVRQYNPGTQPFLKVNRRGLRFTNESSPYNDTSYAAGNQPGCVYAQIHDSNYMEDVIRFHTIGCSAQSRTPGRMEQLLGQYVEEGLIFQADTLEELADKLGFDADAKANFLATVERYNELYDKQSDDDFGKMAPRLSAIRQAPFYGCWLGASLLTTEQGIAINEKTQALDENRNPIEGLYITGDMSGSFFANNYPCLMPGIACGRTLAFAIKAVKQMGGLE